MGDDGLTLLHADARSLPMLDAGSVQLVVTSPPYPMIPQWDALFERLGAQGFDAQHRLLADAWKEAYRLLVDGGLLAINIGDAVRTGDDGFRLWPNAAATTVAAERLGFRPLPYLLWKKPTNKPNAFLGSGFLPPNGYVTLDCEFVLLFRKGGPRSFPRNDPTRLSNRFEKAERDRWFSQIWEGIRGIRQSAGSGRSGAFPPEIPRRLIRMFSLVGETVLDPFAGTGTTLWEARALGRRAVGVEVDEALFQRLQARAAGG